MNWLFYLGGGYIFFILMSSLWKRPKVKDNYGNVNDSNLVLLDDAAIISVWIWICWRFI